MNIDSDSEESLWLTTDDESTDIDTETFEQDTMHCHIIQPYIYINDHADIYEILDGNINEHCRDYWNLETIHNIHNHIKHLTASHIYLPDKCQQSRIILNAISKDLITIPMQIISEIILIYLTHSEEPGMCVELTNEFGLQHENRLNEFIEIDNNSTVMVQVDSLNMETGTTSTIDEFRESYNLTIDESNILFILNNNVEFINNNSINIEEGNITTMTRLETDSLEKCSMFDIDIRDDDEKQCKICYEELLDSDIVTKLTCKHLYHHACLRIWLENKSISCPICRCDVLISHLKND